MLIFCFYTWKGISFVSAYNIKVLGKMFRVNAKKAFYWRVNTLLKKINRQHNPS